MAELSEEMRRKLDEVFGEVLPEVTRDESGADEPRDDAGTDAWLEANRPPHHDRD